MKKFSLLILLCLISSLFASAQTRIGFRGGLQLADMRNKPDDRTNLTDETKMLFGYQAGVVLDYSFNKVMFFQPGILYNSKGSKIEETVTILGISSTTIYRLNPQYIEMPLMFGVRFGLQNLKLFGMAGPYLAYGIGGKSYFKNTTSGVVTLETEESIKWGEKTSLTEPRDLRPFDLGLSFSAGIELGNTQISLFYSPSFTNISPEGSSRKLYNTTIGIQTTLLLGNRD